MSFRASPRLVSGNQMMSTTLSGNSLHAAVCVINLSENKWLFFTFFLNSSSPSSCPFSSTLPSFLQVLLASHPFFCSLPFCCWSLAVFLPPAPSVFGFTFLCVWLYFPHRTHSYCFFFPGSSCTGAVDGMNLGCTGNGTQGLMHSTHKLYYQTPFPASIRWL